MILRLRLEGRWNVKGMRNVGESVNVKKKCVWFYKEIFIYLYLIKTLYV